MNLTTASIDFKLTDGERTHPLWARLEAHLKMKLAEQRAKNDDPKLGPEQTAAVRGHIACLKSMIDLGKEEPPQDGSIANGTRRRGPVIGETHA